MANSRVAETTASNLSELPCERDGSMAASENVMSATETDAPIKIQKRFPASSLASARRPPK